MGIEPTWDALQRPTPDLKSGSPTSELGASAKKYIPITVNLAIFAAIRRFVAS